MSYRNWERQERKEEKIADIQKEGETARILSYKEKKPVKLNRRELYIVYNDRKATKREKPFIVKLVNGAGRTDTIHRTHSEDDAEEFLRGVLRDITNSPQYRADLAEKLEFSLVKAGLGQPEEEVKSKTIEWDSSNRSKVIDEYFHSDEEYIIESVEEAGAYSEAVGQGLRAKVEAK